MATATTTKTTGFTKGIKVWHASEIELARNLFQAVRLTIGENAARRMAKTDPAHIFKRFRYSRCFCPMGENDEMIDAVGDCIKWGNKAPRRWIMTPGRKAWGPFLQKVRQAMFRPYYQESQTTFAATAEGLDESGFAIAESLVVAMLFEAEGDEDILYTTKTTWRTGKKTYSHDATLDD
jgi:hypothetical protein